MEEKAEMHEACTEEAELLFKPGCEAGSDKCDGCGRFGVPNCPYFNLKEGRGWHHHKRRFNQCLEAEVQAKELREKVERSVSLDELRSIEQTIRDIKLIDINSADAHDMRDHIADRLELFIARREGKE